MEYNPVPLPVDSESAAVNPSGTADGGMIYELPHLPDPVPPQMVEGQPLQDLYDIIRALRREVDVTSSHGNVQEMLMGDPKILLAVATVLHQSGMLLRQTVAPDGQLQWSSCPLPSCAAPALPPGVSSWIRHKQPPR